MNVKLQIKEVKEERRGLSDFEWYAYFAGQCIVEPLIYLDKVGLDLKSVDKFERVGTFRTETIRDATLEEINAWHILELDKIRCKRAYSNNIELTTRPDNKEFEKLLLDKEIIFEVSP